MPERLGRLPALLRRSAALVFGAAPWLAALYASLVVANNLLAVLQVWLSR